MNVEGRNGTVIKRVAYGVLLLLVCVFIYSDIDVGVPPGAGYEWVMQMPRATPNAYRTQVTRDNVENTTLMPGYVMDVFSYAKIITVDITNHLKWLSSNNSKLKPADPNELYTKHGNKILEKYPPKIPRDSMWLALAGYLRHLLHTANATEYDAVAYLVYLGDISREAARWAESEPMLKELVNAIKRLIPEAGSEGPALKEDGNMYDKLMYRITWEDLAMAYPFSFEQKFASRLELFGKHALKYIIEATKSKHLFLQRNAVLQLAKYTDREEEKPKAVQRLRELFFETRDAVVRYRALDGLIRAKDKASVGRAMELLESEDKLLQPYLIYAMGMIGDQKAVESICQKVEKNIDNYDIVVAGVQALGRLKFDPKRTSMTEEDKIIIELLKKIEGEAEAGKYKDPAPKMMPDNPDKPNIWKDTVKESVWLALAAMGEKEYQKKYEEHIKTRLLMFVDRAKAVAEIDRQIKELEEKYKTMDRTSPEYRNFSFRISALKQKLAALKGGGYIDISDICPLKVAYFMIDMLSDLHEYEIIKGLIKLVEESVASYALLRFYNSKDDKGKEIIIKDIEFLKSLIDMKSNRPQVAATALGIMFDFNVRPEGHKKAKEIIDGYPGNIQTTTTGWDPRGNRYQPAMSPEAKRFVVAYALKSYCSTGGNVSAEKLRFIIENEEKERTKRKEDLKKPNPHHWDTFGRVSNPIVTPPAPLLEYAVVELGRLRDIAQEDYLIAYLKNKNSDARPEACVALACINTKKCRQALVDMLEDEDGWIRFSAYRALLEAAKGLSKIDENSKDYTADWLYRIGEKWPYDTEQAVKEAEQQRKDAVKRWREWLEAQE